MQGTAYFYQSRERRFNAFQHYIIHLRFWNLLNYDTHWNHVVWFLLNLHLKKVLQSSRSFVKRLFWSWMKPNWTVFSVFKSKNRLTSHSNIEGLFCEKMFERTKVISTTLMNGSNICGISSLYESKIVLISQHKIWIL